MVELRAALDAVRDSDNSSAIASLMEEVQHFRDKETKNAEPWSKVVRKGKGKGKGNGTGKGSRALSEPKEAHVSALTTSHAPHATRKRVPVKNCRKVWGTLRSTSTTVVINAIKQTTPSSLGPSFSIKRKFKNSQKGTTRKWWFVIRGNKTDIDLLDKEWSNIAVYKLAGSWSQYSALEILSPHLPNSLVQTPCRPMTNPPPPLQSQLPNPYLSLPPPPTLPTLPLLQSVKILLELALPLQILHLVIDYLQPTWRVITLMAFHFLRW